MLTGSEDKTREPIPDEATTEDIEEEPIPCDLLAISFDVYTAVQSLEKRSISKSCGPYHLVRLYDESICQARKSQSEELH